MFIVISLIGVVFLTGSCMLLWANLHAVEGYEDERGFHTGRRSQ